MGIAIEHGHEEERTKKKTGGVEVIVGFDWLVVGWGRGWEAVEVESKGSGV